MLIFPHDLIARIEALEAHAKREGQQMCDGAGAERSDQTRGNDMKTDSTLTLLPCPFCGSAAKLHPGSRGYRASVECSNEGCGVGGPDYSDANDPNHDSANEVAESWNRRATQGAATPPAPVAWRRWDNDYGGMWVYYETAIDDAEPLFATPPAIREPDRFEAKDETLIRKALLAFYTNKDNDHAERNRAFAIFQVLRQEVATPAPAPSIPVVHPISTPSNVEQPDGSGGLA